MRVTATGEGTALARIIEAVQRAQTSRANIQRLGDRVSSVFVPIVVGVALASALWWGLAPESALRAHAWLAPFLWTAHPPETAAAAAFIIAAAVLIVACPCAMGLATPAAIMAGANAAAAHGILIRDGVALEKAGLVTAVLFDKTGTLTMGKPVLQASWMAFQQDEARDLATALARPSAHPVSLALVHENTAAVTINDWRETAGSGVSGAVRDSDGVEKPIKLGSLRWLRESQVELASGQDFVNTWSAKGATVVGLAIDTRLVGLFAVQDALKAGSAKVVTELRQQGMEIYLVTGDNARTAESIAGVIGIPPDHVFSEVRPENKAALVAQLQQKGQRVAFVGDGINDAPALQQADLGIAVSRASDIAREAADIILLNSEIEAVPASLKLARATLRTIKQNLFWAFFYNAAGIPLAALGFMSPVLCAAAMGFSDMIVIGNALRLLRFRVRSD
jgi:Cu+-exporting ATPase